MLSSDASSQPCFFVLRPAFCATLSARYGLTHRIAHHSDVFDAVIRALWRALLKSIWIETGAGAFRDAGSRLPTSRGRERTSARLSALPKRLPFCSTRHLGQPEPRR